LELSPTMMRHVDSVLRCSIGRYGVKEGDRDGHRMPDVPMGDLLRRHMSVARSRFAS